ncbi:UNVERIFIED_CONTAM: hypothetical protein Sradi_1906300 [Sesamum radiatum]|uniref:Uncharacterized protein n=1 Tax=Sesamum radiatum TaxID=300843 RepID=A0AAW2TYB1_SESRA
MHAYHGVCIKWRPPFAFRRLIDEEEEEVGGNEAVASSPGEVERTVQDLVAVHPLSSMDWGSSTLKTSHIA